MLCHNILEFNLILEKLKDLTDSLISLVKSEISKKLAIDLRDIFLFL